MSYQEFAKQAAGARTNKDGYPIATPQQNTESDNVIFHSEGEHKTTKTHNSKERFTPQKWEQPR